MQTINKVFIPTLAPTDLSNRALGTKKYPRIKIAEHPRKKVKPEKVSDDQMTLMARDIAKKVEDEMEYPGQIKVNLVRETRVVDYAK